VTDIHAHPKYNNKRAEYLGELIADVKPDVVVFGGDTWDMPSLSSYDKGRKSFQGRTYSADISSGLDFLDRCFGVIRKRKKKQPYFVHLGGNHDEGRIIRAIDLQPELEGTISLEDLQLGHYFDEVVPYNGGTPGVVQIDGISYAHYFVSGVMGRPISGEHPAYSLISKQYGSCSAGHIHTADYAIRTDSSGRKLHGLLGGCFFDYNSDWAGESNRLYWRGCVIKRNVDKGNYSPQFVSMEELKKSYG
jgi:hypothetical protein